MLRYAEAKRAYDSAEDEAQLKPWKNSPVMADVERNSAALLKERRERKRVQK